MEKQKSKSIQKQDNSYNTDISSSNRSKSEPPGWQELFNKAAKNINLSKFSSKTVGYILATLTLGFGTSLIPFLAFSIPGGWFTSIFLVSLFGSIIGQGSYSASAISGGLILGISALISGFMWAIISGGLTVMVSVTLGALIGLFGTEIGKRLN